MDLAAQTHLCVRVWLILADEIGFVQHTMLLVVCVVCEINVTNFDSEIRESKPTKEKGHECASLTCAVGIYGVLRKQLECIVFFL